MYRLKQAAVLLSPIMVLYFFGWLNSIGLYDESSPWKFANLFASILLFSITIGFSVFVINMLIADYCHWKKEIEEKRRAAIRLIQGGGQ